MKIRSIAALAVLTIATLGAGTAVSTAAPATAPATEVGYETTLSGTTVVTTLHGGFFEVRSDGATVDVKDSAGAVLVTMPLAVRLDNVVLPLAHAVRNGGTVLDLTPQPAAIQAGLPLMVKPVASPLENQRAEAAFASQFGIATAVGSFVGTAIGAVVGGIIGASACVTIIACLPGIITGAGVGAIIGTIAVGGPALVIAGIDLISTLTSAPGSTKWNYVLPN